ncbi:MAG: OmpA family protein, partial [Bacteroidota bacterium]
TRVEEKRGGLGWLWWVLPLLLLLLALFLLRDCDGCNKAVPAEPGTPTSEQAPPPPVEETPKEPFGPDGAALGFGVGTMAYNMANFLSDPDRSFPRNFGSDNILFSRNRARLSGTSKRELDDLVALLKEYPDINVDMYGYIDGTESGTYRGSKEVSLDDVRAREVFNYLKSAGLDAGRLNFEGAGTDDRRTVEFGLRKN